MNFKVDPDALALNLIDGEIRGRMATRNNPAKRADYIKLGIINSSSSINEFMRNYPQVFGNPKFIHSDGSNFFEEIMPIVTTSKEPQYNQIKSRMKYGCDLSEDELSQMDGFITDLYGLKDEPEIQNMVSKTETYKRSIERAWKLNENIIMKHIYRVLDYVPEKSGKVDTYVVYPNFNTHRSYQSTDNKTSLFFGKHGEKDLRKILANLSHQRVHQPMLPYKKTMTREEKEEFHAFIKFLTDKDIYHELSGGSYLEITTPKENPEVMGKIYPFWLGYRYRNAKKEGLDPVEEIKKAIERDKTYYDSMPDNSSQKALYAHYEFDKLSPEKIVAFFRERKGIDPYQFAKLDFDNKEAVYKPAYLRTKKTEEQEAR
jgi:hypothetical protein